MDSRTFARLMGIVFILVGILGFIPGLNRMHGQHEGLVVHGPGHGYLLGLFHVNLLHNLVHLLFGVAGLAAARSWSGARAYLIGGGVIYAVLWLYGLLIDEDSNANFVPVNDADNWLHLLLGVGMVGVGVALSRGRTADRV